MIYQWDFDLEGIDINIEVEALDVGEGRSKALERLKGVFESGFGHEWEKDADYKDMWRQFEEHILNNQPRTFMYVFSQAKEESNNEQ